MTIYHGFFPKVEKLTERGVINSLLLDNPRITPTNVAIIDASSGESIIYKELVSEVLRFGNGLSNAFTPGTTILIFSLNSLAYPVIALGAVAAGLTVTTANPAYKPLELVHQIQDSSTSIIFASSDFLDLAKEAMTLSGLDPTNVWAMPGADGKVVGDKSYLQFRADENWKPVEIKDKKVAVAYLPYSSGTTGKPKGVEISHWNLESVSQIAAQTPVIARKEISIGTVPLFHAYGLMVLLHQSLYDGSTVIIMPRFELVTFCKAVQRWKPSLGWLVPPVALMLAKNPIVLDYDLSSIEHILCGAAPLSADLQKVVETRVGPKAKMLQGYGMTETSGIAMMTDIAAPLIGSCGKLLANMEARLVDDDGNDVPMGKDGELWLRGPNILKGYHNNIASTKDTITDDGWLKTGDVCITSETGDFYITDRKKELIKVNGSQVAPAELESLLVHCPAVMDVAVIGVWNEEKQTEFPRAYVTLNPGVEKNDETRAIISEYVSSRLVAYKRLGGGVIFMDEIPKSASGKILRKDLRVLAAKEKAQAKL